MDGDFNFTTAEYNSENISGLSQTIQNSPVSNPLSGTYVAPNLSSSTYFFQNKISGETSSGSQNAAIVSKAIPELVINAQILPEGFGSYLQDILPNDIAITAGAFGCTMQQVKNITTIPAEKFAQIVSSIETTQGLDLVNGTNVPTATQEVNKALPLIALGSGPYGMYTYSDFFGCMSGLPYPWQQLQTLIQNIQTDKLTSIYNQLYLSTAWKGATASVQYTTYDVLGVTYYTVTGLTLVNAGGGYGRAGAAAPTISISNGGTGITTIGTNPVNIGADGNGTYGRVLSVSLTSAGPDSTSVPTATIQTPPTAYYSYPYTGGTNTVSGTLSNATVQSLIDDTNTEIAVIRTLYPGQSVQLNDLYEKTGAHLNIEQRARVNGYYPLPSPRDGKFNQYPTIILSFTDALAPKFSKEVEPHMAAQTLEAISDLDLIAGQSVVARMRESRNEQRSLLMNSPLDNNVPEVLDPEEIKEWIVNGTVGDSIPAYPETTLGRPTRVGYYDPVTHNLVITSTRLAGLPGSTQPTQTLLVDPFTGALINPLAPASATSSIGVSLNPLVPFIGSATNPLIPFSGAGLANPLIPFSGSSSNPLSPLTPIFGIGQGLVNPLSPFNASLPGGGIVSSSGTGGLSNPLSPTTVSVVNPANLNRVPIAATGAPIVLGSLAGSPYANILPPTLNSLYTSPVLLPGTPTVQQAIDDVVRCNCDCWIQ